MHSEHILIINESQSHDLTFVTKEYILYGMSFASYTEIHFKTMWVTTMLKLAIQNSQALITVKMNLSFQQYKLLFIW